MRYNNLFDGQNMLSSNVVKPVPVTMVKGSVHIVVQRGFVDYVVNNKVVLVIHGIKLWHHNIISMTS